MNNSTTQQLTNKFGEAELIEPEHIYNVRGSRFSSVSENLKRFYTPFDKGIAKWCAVAENNAPKSDALYGYDDEVTEQEILDRWEEKSTKAKIKGTDVHLFGELYGKGLISREQADHPQKEAIVQWYDNMPPRYRPIAFEQILYWLEEGIAGTTDLILECRRTGALIPVDWKSNETDLFKVYNNAKLLPPFDFLPDCQFTKYELQLSYYKAMLKLAGFKVGPAILVWLKPEENGKSYQAFKTRDFSNTLIKYHHDIRPSNFGDSIGIL